MRGGVAYETMQLPGRSLPLLAPMSETYALTNVTLPYALAIANTGLRAAAEADPSLALGIKTVAGHVTYAPVAVAHGLAATPWAEVLG